MWKRWNMKKMPRNTVKEVRKEPITVAKKEPLYCMADFRCIEKYFMYRRIVNLLVR